MTSALHLGRYVIERRLAAGGMSEVLLAHLPGPEGFRRHVVIKRLLPKLAGHSDAIELFLNEARIAARFHHPNLINVHELFEVDGQYCLAMELLDGVDVAQILRCLSERKRLMDPFLAASLIADAALGLHYAHELCDDTDAPIQVVHRDVSPSNIFVTWPGQVKVVDFGIAKSTERRRRDTGVTAVRGKLRYMSPEQVDASPLDRRSDIFSLGLVFYEMLTGELAFPSASPADTVRAVHNAKVRPIHTVRDGVPEGLAGICAKMLARKPSDRYTSAEEVALALQEIVRRQASQEGGVTALLDVLFAVPSQIEIRRVPTAVSHDGDEKPGPGLAAKLSVRRRPFIEATLATSIAAIVTTVVIATTSERPRPPVDLLPSAMAETDATSGPGATSGSVAASAQPELEDLLARPAAEELKDAKRVTKSSTNKGRLVVDVEPWADVYIRGKKLGTTPLPPTPLAEGTYTLELRNPTRQKSRLVSVHVTAGKLAKVYATLP